MENIDKNSVFWNHMSDEEKKMFVEITQNASNIVDDEENIQITNESNIMEQDIELIQFLLEPTITSHFIMPRLPFRYKELVFLINS